MNQPQTYGGHFLLSPFYLGSIKGDQSKWVGVKL